MLYGLLCSILDEEPEDESSVDSTVVRTIVPWVAPPAGVPHSVLLNIRRSLLLCLRRTACPQPGPDPAQVPLPSTPPPRQEPDDMDRTLADASGTDSRESSAEVPGEIVGKELGVQESD